MKKVIYLLLTQLTFYFSNGQKSIINSVMSEGEMPLEFKQKLSEVAAQNKTSEFDQVNKLGILELLNSGRVVYGNSNVKYIENIGKKILESSNLNNEKLHFYILRSLYYNAFATHEGYIFATTSMLAQASSEDEIAFILSHEISHYLLKHSLKQFEFKNEKIKALSAIKKRKKKRNIDGTDEDFEKLLIQYYQYSKQHELQADSLGSVLYIKAGYNPNLLSKIMLRLESNFPVFDDYKLMNNNPFLGVISIPEPLSLPSIYKGHLDQFEHKYEKNTKELSKSKKDIDSNYSTHPDVKIRAKRLYELTNKVKRTDSLFEKIPDNMKNSLMMELFLELFQARQNFKAYCLLLILEQQVINLESLSWKALLLEQIRYNAVINKNYFIGFKQENRGNILQNSAVVFSTIPNQKLELLSRYANYKAFSEGSELFKEIHLRLQDTLAIDSIVIDDLNDSMSQNKSDSIFRSDWVIPTFIPQKQNNQPVVENVKNYFHPYSEFMIKNKYENNSPKPAKILLLGPMLFQYNILNKNVPIAYKNFEDKSIYYNNEYKKYAKKYSLTVNHLNLLDKNNLDTKKYNNYYCVSALLNSYLRNALDKSNVGNGLAQFWKSKLDFNDSFEYLVMNLGTYNEYRKQKLGLTRQVLLSPLSLIFGVNAAAFPFQDNSRIKMIQIVFNIKSDNLSSISVFSRDQYFRFETISQLTQIFSNDLAHSIK